MSAENDDNDHVQPEDAEAILARAVELAAGDDGPPEERVPVAELERAAAEVGVPSSAVAAAVAEHAQRRRRRVAAAGAVALVAGCAGLLGVGTLLLAGPTATETRREPLPVAPATAPGATTAPEAAPSPPDDTPETTPEPPPAVPQQPEDAPTTPAPPPAAEPSEPDAEPSEPDAEPSEPGALLPVPLSGDEAGAAQSALVGTWQLVAWVAASGEPVEVAASARAATEASAEVWHFLAGGRFRRTLGDDFASSGRWSVLSRTDAPQSLRWLGVDTWWLVALDQVRLTALPTQVRPREWVLVGRDGDERLIFYLGATPDLSVKTMGARSVAATTEGSRP